MRKLQVLLPMLLMAIFGFAQQRTITGTVRGKADNTPIQGVTVKAGNKTVQTDAAGKFSVETSVGDAVTFSYVGMKSSTVKITGDTQDLNVQLEEGGGSLE